MLKDPKSQKFGVRKCKDKIQTLKNAIHEKNRK